MSAGNERNEGRRRCIGALAALALAVLPTNSGAAQHARSLELSRPVRPWEFLNAVGTRAGIFGSEAGRFEVWVYPLKILRDFALTFHLSGRSLPAESLGRTVQVRPESSSILYAGDSFSVRETWFVPPREPGALVLLEIETAEPLEIEASFERDFQLMWPAGLGGTYLDWNENLHAFAFGEEQRRFFALVGSPSASEHHGEFASNYASAPRSSFKLGRSTKGTHFKVIAIAASFDGAEQAEKTYADLLAHARTLQEEAANYYAQNLAQTLALKLPDAQLQQAYDWSRVSLLQGIVSNPFLGTGLIAGYRGSGSDARPGFAWFFGRDALWTALALISAGDFAHARTALEFLARYQRADGKITHEISQSATFVPWFKDYPYAYASADATPLFLIAANEYAVSSGDLAFVREKWAELGKAWQYLRSTWDGNGFAQNQGAGHGWVEGGPLLPVRAELYQAALGVEALGAMANLARLAGREEVRKELEPQILRQKEALNQTFWIPEKKFFAFGLDPNGKKIEEASVLATVPMWFGLFDPEKADAMIDRLAESDHATDWGMRILSSQSEKFSPDGYHFGSVWPLFTGWAAVGEYRYHRPLAAYANLRANALLALDGALGHVTEVLSGSYYQPLATSSPQQVWSSAMVISPLLRGLLGLQTHALAKRVSFSPHLPATWDALEVRNLRLRKTILDLAYRRAPGEIALEIRQSEPAECAFEFSPALSPRAKIEEVQVNNRPVPFRLEASASDQHVNVRFTLYGGRNSVRIRLKDDFGFEVPAGLPPLGAASRNLRVLSESWNASRDRLEIEVAGLAGKEYSIALAGAEQIASVEGAKLETAASEKSRLVVGFPAQPPGYVREKIIIQFVASQPKR